VRKGDLCPFLSRLSTFSCTVDSLLLYGWSLEGLYTVGSVTDRMACERKRSGGLWWLGNYLGTSHAENLSPSVARRTALGQDL
jgi:hypothetical protein